MHREEKDAGDYSVRAEWSTPDPLTLRSCSEETDLRIDVLDRNGRVVHSMRGIYAARMFCLLDVHRRGNRINYDFNCHATANAVCGPVNDVLRFQQVTPTGGPMDIRKAAQTFDFPFLCRSVYLRVDENAEDDAPEEIVRHSAVVLGRAKRGFLVFDKPGNTPVRITTLERMRKYFLRGEFLSYFGPMEQADVTEQR